MTRFLILLVVIGATTLALSLCVRQIIYAVEDAPNTYQLKSNPRILVGDSHAAQLDLDKSSELSIQGSSLTLLNLILDNAPIFLDSSKTIIATIWHQNLVKQHSPTFNQKIQFWSALMSLPFSIEINQTYINSSPSVWSKIGLLALKRSQLNNSGTCFEGTFEYQKALDPRFKITQDSSQIHLNIIPKLQNCPANVLLVVSPNNPNNYENKEALVSITDNFLTRIPKANHISVLDLRHLQFPDSCWRDWHHLNCKGSRIVSEAVEARLSELNWN